MAAQQKISVITRILHLLNRHAIWLTLFVSTFLLLIFYFDFIFSNATQKLAYIPIGHYTSMDRIPLWNPNLNSGMPIWGNPDDISRINVVDSLLFSLLKFLQPFIPNFHFLYLLLNLLLFSGFMFAFLRQLGLRPIAASFIAIIIQLMPQYVINIVDGHWTAILALTLTPAILFFTLLLLEQRKLIWFVLGTFFIAFQLLRASLAVSVSTLALILVLYFAYSLHWRVKSTFKTFMGRGILCLTMIGFAFLLAAYVYFPYIEFFHYSMSNNGPSSFSLKDFFLYVYPSFNGNVVNPDGRFVLYFSVVILFLAGFAILLRRDWQTYLLLVLGFACLFVSFLGYWDATIYAVPFIALVLAGIGLNALIKYRQKTRTAKGARWLDIYMLIVWGVFSAGFMIFLLNKPGYMQHILRQSPLLTLLAQQAYYKKVLFEGASAFVLIGFAFLFVRLYLSDKIRVAFFVAALWLLIFIDLFVVDYKLVAAREKKAPPLPSSVLATLAGNHELFRVFSTANFSLTPYHSLLGESKTVLKMYDVFLKRAGFGEKDEPGMRNPFFSKYTRLVARGDNIVEEPIPVDYIDPILLHFDRVMLDMLNVKYIVSYSPIHDSNYFVVYDGHFFVYENTSVLPRAFFVDSVFVLPGSRAIFDAMQTEDFNPRQIAFLEQDPPFQVFKADSNTVDIRSYKNGRMDLDVDIKQPTLLFINEVYYPVGWLAFVDGQKTEIYKTNYFLKSIFLKPGARHVRLLFLPTTFKIGVWVSLTSFAIFLFGLVAGLVFYFKKRDL